MISWNCGCKSERSEQLHLVASELTLTEQRERQRLAQILHDGLQQILVAAKYRLALLKQVDHEDARSAAAEMGALMDDAIRTSRSLTAELSPPILHEGGIVPALEWLARWMRDNHGLDLKLEVGSPVGTIDEEVMILLFQATRELLLNVVKHAGVREARAEVVREGSRIQIVVEDRGAGFDPSNLRVPGANVGGFGMVSIRERLSLFGGRVEIDSAPGRGCRVSLIAPTTIQAQWTAASRRKGEPGAAMGKSIVQEVAAPSGRRIRILLVDDHILMRQGLTRLLAEEGDMEIVGEASDGEEAIRVARAVQPDVVLMDISMPGMNGIRATEIIRTEMPDIRVIGLSMSEESEAGSAMLRAGAVVYRSKSGPSAALLQAIRNCYGSEKEPDDSGKVPVNLQSAGGTEPHA